MSLRPWSIIENVVFIYILSSISPVKCITFERYLRTNNDVQNRSGMNLTSSLVHFVFTSSSLKNV